MNTTINNTNKNINLSMFIVPNDGVNMKYRLECLQDDDIEQCENLGIPLTRDEDVFQVWMHCPELNLDNVTDHGLGNEIKSRLGITAEGRVFAPTFVPFSQFEGHREGETVSFTAPNGATVNIKLEQLPYRYRSFGRFEEVLKRISYATRLNNEFQEKMKNK